MSSINRLLGAVQRRERLADATNALTRWALPAGLLIAAGCLVAVRRFGAPFEMLWLTGLPLPVLAAWALLRPRSLRAAARRVDDHYRLEDAIGNAYELASSPPRGVTGDDPRTDAIIEILRDEAETRAASLDPRPVVPLKVPGPRVVDGLALAAVVGAMFIPRPEPQQMQRWFAAPQLDALLMLPTRAGLDLALADPLRQNLRGLAEDEDTPSQIAEKILETLDKLESGELDRAEAFAELERLEELLREAEDEFEAKLDEDPGMLADAMRDLAEALEEHEITEEAGKALDDGRSEDAEDALNEAAEKAESGSQAEQDAARKAMEEAERRLKDAANRKSDTADKLDEAERRLRKEQKKKNPADPEEHERRLKKMKERVEQLRRQQQREQAAQRRLDQLRRNAQDAAKAKSGQQRKRSMQKLSRGASGAARKSRQASRMRQIRDAMDEAKTFVRRAGKQGDSANRRRQQFRRFSKAAKGKKGKQGKQGKNGKKGKTTLLVEGDVGKGQQPDMFMEGDGQGQDGQGQDGQGQDGQGQDGQGQNGQGQDGGQGLTPGGDGIGDGSVDPNGEDNGIDAKTKSVHVKAREGRGVSRAEVISESSQEGFATESYRDVFTDYRRFAQSALDNEALPPAQRRAVKRYYQHISPRD